MCYAIPGKVEKIEGRLAIVDYFGQKKKAINEIDGLKPGDYIYAQGGYIIQVIPEQEALSILAVWKETFFELQEVDLRLSQLDLAKEGIDKKLTLILDKAAEGRPLKDQELLYLLGLEKPNELALLYKTANFLRAKHLGNSCCVHGIIEFSNYCSQNCAYCGINSGNKKINRYRMSRQEIIATALEAINKWGFKALVLQSGEAVMVSEQGKDEVKGNSGYSVEELASIIEEIKRRAPVLIFISFGEIGLDGLERLYQAGARGLLMRFETSNPALYQKLHPGSLLDTRLEHIRAAYKMGYLILTGGLIGLPAQTKEQARQDLLNDILLARELKAEMYSFGPFLPHPETSLNDARPPRTDEVMKVLAVCRLADPKNAKILVTTGFETLDPKARRLGLMVGANSVMLNVTPEKYRKDYDIYPDRAHRDETLPEQIASTLYLLKELGRAPTDLGISE